MKQLFATIKDGTLYFNTSFQCPNLQRAKLNKKKKKKKTFYFSP